MQFFPLCCSSAFDHRGTLIIHQCPPLLHVPICLKIDMLVAKMSQNVTTLNILFLLQISFSHICCILIFQWISEGVFYVLEKVIKGSSPSL